MSVKYYHLVVKEVIQETLDTITISFWHPVHQSISYKAGQFLTLIPEINGKKMRRSYSMSSSPYTDASIAITIKRVPNGVVSNYLNNQIKANDAIEVMEPMGNFVFIPDASQSRNIILFGAGSGITPLVSIAKSVLTIETKSNVVLIYGNRHEESIIFKKQLEALEQKFSGRFTIKHILSQPSEQWSGLKGRIDQTLATTMLAQISNFDAQHTDFFMCGPSGMMQEVQTALYLLNISPAKIHLENFGENNQESKDLLEEESETLSTQQVEIHYDGHTHTFEVKPHQTILEAALDLDIDLPYSCQAGMCTACLGKCTAGKVMMDEEDGLTENEIKKGYILTCVAHPMSKGVIIEVE